MSHFRILFYDPRQRHLQPLTESIESSLPCTVCSAGSEDDFVSLLTDFSPALVVADGDAGTFSGWDILPLLRRNYADIPCILLVSAMSDGDEERAVAGGAADLILKDRPGRLVTTIRRIASEIDSRNARIEVARRDLHLDRLRLLVQVSTEILSEPTLEGILQKITEAAREVSGSRYSVAGYGCGSDFFRIIGFSHAEGAPLIPPEEIFQTEQGGAYLELLRTKRLLRLTDQELRTQAGWRGLPEWHVPLRGLLGGSLLGQAKEPLGVLMVTDKMDGSDFSAEDEALLAQLSAMASLAIKHVEAQDALQQANETLERRVQSRNAELVDVVSALQKEIAERRKAEKALRKSEKRYRSIFAESKDVICILDCDLRIVDINPASRAVFGVPRKQLLHHDLAELYGKDEDRDSFRQQLLRHGFLRDFLAELKRPDGGRLNVVVSAAEIHEDDGAISGYWAIIRDVTEHRRLEQQLLQAQKMESIGVLAGGVAHDFNNLLTAISGYSQIIQSVVEPGDEPVASSIGHILAAAERASDLTRNLLAFSRKQILNPRTVPLNDIVKNTADFLSRIIGEDIDFTCDLSEGNLLVMADAGQIGQVLMNFAANARDAMPSGGRIVVATSRISIQEGATELYGLDLPGEYGVISFSDTGVGMDERTKSRIFEPFFTTKEIGKGTGLGLSIIYGIVRQHNGTVTVDSNSGSGTTFRIYLPLAEVKARESEQKAQVVATGGTETILVAEDDPTVRLYMKGVLENAGYTVLTAVNGEDAVERFSGYPGKIDLLITDVVMPKMTGREVFTAVSALVPETRVIYISGYTADIVHKNLLMEDDVNFIMKPVSGSDLLMKVREVVDAGAGHVGLGTRESGLRT